MSGFGSFKSSFSKFVDETKGEIKGKKGNEKKDEKLVSNPPPQRPSQQPINLNKSNEQQPQYQPQYQQPLQQPQYQPQQPQQSINLNKSNEQQYQYDGASTINTTVQPHRPAPPPKPITTNTTTVGVPVLPPKPTTAPQYQKPQFQPNPPPQQQQQDGASTISLDKSTDEKVSESVKKHTGVAKTNANIALHSIGVPLDHGTIHANIPPLYLSDATYLLNVQYTEIVLEIEETTVKPIQFGKKMDPIYKKEKLIIYKTIIEDIIIIQIGEIFIYTNLREKPSFRAYPYHYIISDNYNNYFMIKLDKDSTIEEQINKLELLLTYYTTYYRVPPKVEYDDKTAKKIEKAADKTESTSQSISNGLVSGGTYVAKGAGKVSSFYQKNTKKYDGPEMTEQQRKELEDPDSKYNKTGKTTQKMVQGTASVTQGIKQGCGFVGGKVSQGVHSTSWYKEKEAKKQEEERLHGKNEKKEAGGQMASSGVGALKTVFGGFEEGVLISARGVRDASVDATRHTSGDFAAERSKKGWNSAGDVTLTVVNLTSILGATWIKAIVYAGVGAISYDPNLVNALGGSYWKGGWLTMRSDLLSGSNWHPRWVVLRNCCCAIYTSPTDPSSKPLQSFYLSSVRGVSKICETRSHRPHCFDVITVDGAISFSAHVPEVDFSNTYYPNPDDEIFQWSNSILSVSTFVGDLKE